jgi:hypothetical protein
LLEVKGEGKRLTQAQEEFVQTWPGEIHVCRTIDEAIAAVIGRTWPAASSQTSSAASPLLELPANTDAPSSK